MGDQSGPIADRINALPKYVLSRTLPSADEWSNSTIVSWDDVPGLRERANLVSYGCGRLARDLAAAGLLDTLQIYVAPVAGGGSARLFDAPEELITGLRLEGGEGVRHRRRAADLRRQPTHVMRRGDQEAQPHAGEYSPRRAGLGNREPTPKSQRSFGTPCAAPGVPRTPAP